MAQDKRVNPDPGQVVITLLLASAANAGLSESGDSSSWLLVYLDMESKQD